MIIIIIMFFISKVLARLSELKYPALEKTITKFERNKHKRRKSDTSSQRGWWAELT